jgi:hypothetical protein
MIQHSRHRLVFGLFIALTCVVVLVVHMAGLAKQAWYKVDQTVLALLAGLAGSLAFALSEHLGITKITSPLVTLELADKAVKRIPPEHLGQTSEVISKHSDLFPAIGARVLWVDDEPEKLIAHRQVFRRLGIEVITATSTEEAKRELERDADFVLIVQDNLRKEINDAKSLVGWLKGVGRQKYRVGAPLVVYSLDKFDPSVGADEQDWITKDFGSLLSRVVNEIHGWSGRPLDAPPKSLR